ncbi:DNA-binding protein [Stutzerimonas zhaodongensis]|uniref:DNA-binding protein n=1 Tax=Stutzerimonas zhaodongensis TaxID=1176257 RepID=UPI0021048B5F|nr:DNA-binding protein [Stutzerimonas zhaodongensis]MCQ2032243.1 DNA-binding protein [Stutzerimonas zhaodongensis]
MTGRKAEVSDEQVIEAGKQLLSEGQRITGFSLRKRIGAGTPARLFDVWKAKGQSSPPTVVTEEEADLPIELADHVKEAASILGDRLMTMARDMNQIATRTHERRVRDWIQKAEEKTRQAEAEVADAGQLFEEAEQRANDAEDRIKELEAELKQSQKDAQQQRLELTETKTQLTSSVREIDSLTTKLEKTELERDNFKDLASEANGALRVREDRIDELKAENTKLAEANSKLEQSKATLTFQFEQSEKSLEKVSKDRDTKGQEARRLESQVSKLQGKEESLNSQIAHLEEVIKLTEAHKNKAVSDLVSANHEIFMLKNPTPPAPDILPKSE